MKKLSVSGPRMALLILGGLGAGCGGRGDLWDRPVGVGQAFGLTDAVAIADADADRVLLLTTDAARNLTVTPVATQRGVRTVKVAPDRSKLFVVSEGDGDRRPPQGQTAQTAALEIIARSATTTTLYPLSEPLAGLALDPRGEWAVLYADQTSGALVRNPNELLLVDLKVGPQAGLNPRPHTLRSFGGQPQRFTFTDLLQLPGGARRLLIVETEQDVAILDLSRPNDPEITIQLTSGLDTRRLTPAGVAVSDGDAATDDARIAIRLANDPTIIMARFVPGEGRDFRPELNLTDVGGLPSDAAFVRTDGGLLALAVLVPSRSKAVVIDPSTSLTQDVALPAPYRRLSLVTGQATATAAASAVDVALLWDGGAGNAGGVSFWELGRTAGQPYRAVETVGVTAGVSAVLDVGGDHPELKILGTNAATFFLLNLKTRTSSPFLTSTAGVALTASVVGDRAWAYLPNTSELSVVDLENLHPERMRIDRAISAVFEIAAVDNNAPAASRSLVVWHEIGNRGATVYDARAAGTAAAIDDRHNYVGILTGGL